MVGWVGTVQSETLCQDMTNTQDVTLMLFLQFSIK